ncbi:dactylin [Anaeramoeba flamelloides]|uniref:Dactylin n=1 Tax=Anaeramoeba flamelloides TaxID=1746091 RepID=A0ABQ8YVW8_9EUKA|nr:dactylin [Anaeramoeba flamelloides]
MLISSSEESWCDSDWNINEEELNQEQQELNYQNHFAALKILFQNNLIDKYTFGEMIKTPPKLKQAPKTKDAMTLIDLPEEILWMIMEYLQPIKLGWVGLTCKTLSDASQNQSIWRQIAKNNQEMYSWESITFYQNVTSFNQNNTLLGVPANLILKMMPSNISFDKKSKINEKNLDKNNNSSQKLPLTTKKIRLKYIDKLQDPKKSITEKIDQIKLQYKLLEQHIHNYQEDQKETGIDNDYRVGDIKYYRITIFFNFWVALLLGGVFIVLLLASLKLDGVISVKWYLVFLPIFISFGLLLCIMCVMIKVNDSDEEDDIGLISLVYLCLVLLPIIIFLILYAIYLDYSVIDNFFAVLAPLFILHIVNTMAFIFILYRAYRDLFRSY